MSLTSYPRAAKPDTAEKPKQEQTQTARSGKAFQVQFFSLKRGQSIAPATMILYDRGALEIKIEHETLLNPQGRYTTSDFPFESDWSFTIKKEKPFHYVCHFSGLYFFDTYAAGLVTLKEYIDEGRLTQEVPFIFFAVAADK
jgi:hypothetical protein